MPGIGAATLLKRSGTVMSIETIVMRPSTFGFWPSGPEIFSARSAVAVTMSFAHDLGVSAGQANGAGKAGGRVESDLAARGDRAAVRRRSGEPIDADRYRRSPE